MNFNSVSFKISIMFILVFLLIPIAFAMDSNDTSLEGVSQDLAVDDTPVLSSQDIDDKILSKSNIDSSNATVSKSKDDIQPKNTSDNLDTAGRLKVTSSADLVLTKTSNVDRFKVGDVIVWTVKVTNKGPNRAVNVNVTDRVKWDIEFVSFTTTKGDFNPLEGIWTIGDLDVGESVYLVLYGKTLSSKTKTNWAIVESDTPDPDFDNNYDHATVYYGNSSDKQKYPVKRAASRMHPAGNPVYLVLISMFSLCIISLRKP